MRPATDCHSEANKSVSHVVLDFNKKNQEILGLGAALTDASCNVFSKMPSEARAALFNELFATSGTGLGLNLCRISIGASDYSASLYSYDEGEPDPDMTRFDIAHDRDYIIPMLKEARAVNPDLFLLASPWSPPGWMKSNGSMLGGAMRMANLAPYAKYIVKFLQAYESAGVPVQFVTVQNEVDTDQDGAMPACLWPQSYEGWFIKDHLVPALEKEGMPNVKVWMTDHNYDLWGRTLAMLQDPGFRQRVGGVAWHGYGGNIEDLNRIHDAFPEVPMYFTEHTPVLSAPDYQTDWARWGNIFTDIFRHHIRSATIWNIALDENGKPNIGPFGCGGLVTVNSQTHEVVKSGAYWGLMHFSKFVSRGAFRVASSGELKDVCHVAFANPDGRKVLVLTNSGEAKTVTIENDGAKADVAMDKDSIVTLVWR